MESLITIDQANPFIGIDQILLSDIEMARVNATLLAMAADGVTVTMNDQTTLFIPIATTQHLEGKQVGDTIALVTDNHSTYRVDAEATNEEILLLLKHYYNGEKLLGVVQSRKHNGLIVKINNTDAFLPINQIEIESQHNLDRLIGEELEFRLLSLKVKLKELSRFTPILSLLNVQKLDELDAYRRFARAHAINDVVSGVVTSMSKYGVFVTLESNIVGFIHISNLSWIVIENPADIVRIGQEIQVVFLSLNLNIINKQRLALGHKQLQQKPFEKLDPSLTEGDVTNGVVHFINKHGLIVELDCGAVGFVHKSELDWNSAVTLDSFSKGKQVTVMIMTIDREKEKLFFSIKQAQIDPWLEIDRYVSIGQRVKGKVNRILAFGVVVDIYQRYNCLLHRSDMAYHASVNRLKDVYTIGDEIDVTVIEIDREKKRIILSEKQEALAFQTEHER